MGFDTVEADQDEQTVALGSDLNEDEMRFAHAAVT